MRCRCSRSAMRSPTRRWPSSSSASAAFCGCRRTSTLAFTAEPKIDGLSCRCATSTAGCQRARPAATAPKARTSPRTSARSRTSRRQLRGRNVPEICEVRGEVYMTKSAFPRAQRAPEGGRQAGFRQPAQLGGGLAAPARSGNHGIAAARLLRLCLGRDERAAGRHPVRHGGMVRRAAASRPTR